MERAVDPKDPFEPIIALWNVNDVREFAPVVNQYIYKKSSRDHTTVANFLVSRLWPFLVKQLSRNEMAPQQLHAKLAQYVREREVNPSPAVPSCLLSHVESKEEDRIVTELIGSPMDYSTIVEHHVEEFYPGSRQWMFDKFEAWKESDSTIFVLISAAGMGKTSWAAKLVEDHEEQNIVAWHFCNVDQAAMSQPKRMLLSLASQLVINVASYGVALAKVVKRSLALDQKISEYRQQLLDREPLNELFRVFFQEPFGMINSKSVETKNRQ